MFYYPTVLQRHGRFATIWLAATKGTKIMKREYLRVNVMKTCEEIIQYILVQVEPPYPGGSRPRFSLYLSAQLEYGVVKVYYKQCEYLIEEIQHILERLSRVEQQMKIDMVDLEQPGLLLPDFLHLMDSYEDAPNPFFGVMGVEELPSPSQIPQMRYILEARTPSPRRSPEPVPERRPGKKPEEPVPTVALPEDITLREMEPIQMPEIEYEKELPEITAQEMEMLIDQEEPQFVEEEVPVVPKKPTEPPQPETMEEERGLEPERPEQITLSPERIKEVTGPEFDSAVLLDEVTGKPFVISPLPAVPTALEVTPPVEVTLPPSPTISVSPRPPRVVPKSPELHLPQIYEIPEVEPKRRRRQLQFIDDVTQIPRQELQEQMSNINTQCRKPIFIEPPSKRTRTASELLDEPTYSQWIPVELHRLWTRCANVETVDYARRRAAEVEEEAEEARIEEMVSELEVVREGLEPSIPLMMSSEISLEVSEEDKSRVSLIIPEEKRLIHEPELEEGRPPLPAVLELPEAVAPIPEPILEEERIDITFVQRLCREEIEQFGETDFETLAPHTLSRLAASKMFFFCLVLAGSQILSLEQAEPYGPIIIRPGPRF